MDESSVGHSASSSNPAQAANKWQQSILRALAKAPLHVIAEALNKDETGACRVRSGETKVTLNEALALIDALDFKGVPKASICVNREKYGALATIAQSAMADPVISHRLMWEDGE